MSSESNRARPFVQPCFLAGLALLAGPLWVLPGEAQQPVPIGAEIQVNSYTTDSQARPDVEALASGDFVIVWDSDGGFVDVDGKSVEAQRFASDGTFVGVQFVVNEISSQGQYSPAIASIDDGTFVVVWQSPDSSDYGIFGRRFSAEATPIGGEFQVNTSTFEYQYEADVASRGDAGFVVTWHNAPYSGVGTSVSARRFSAGAVPLGDDFQVNTATHTGRQEEPRIETFADDSFLIVWQDDSDPLFADQAGGLDGDGFSIQGRRFLADGTPAGDQAQINTQTTNDQLFPSVRRLQNGSLQVAYASNDDLRGQQIDLAGQPVGSEMLLSSHTPGTDRRSDIATLSDGTYAVTWEGTSSPGTDSSFDSIQARRFAADGSPLGAQFQVNQITTSTQAGPAIASLAEGAFVVTWQTQVASGNDDEETSIAARLFGIDSDGDLVADAADNCPSSSNPGQEDFDSDGVGDPCDNCPGFDDNLDGDGDGVPDDCDLCLGDDSSGDGDGDGVCASVDCDDNDAGATVLDACGVCGGDDSTCSIFSDGFELGSKINWS